MIKKLLLFTFFSVLIIYSCANQKNNSNKKNAKTNQIVNYKQLAYEKFGPDTIFLFSPKENFVLCKKAIDESSVNPNILNEFFVYDTENKKVLYEDKIPGAVISWNSNTELLIIEQKGIITSTKDSGKSSYIYNILNNKKENFRNNKTNN